MRLSLISKKAKKKFCSENHLKLSNRPCYVTYSYGFMCDAIIIITRGKSLKVSGTGFYARQQNASRVLAIAWASVRLSVCLSHCCIVLKRCKLGSRNFYHWLPQGLWFFCDKISCLWVRGFHSIEGVKEGNPLKRRYFAVIGSYSVKTVADR